MAFTVEALAAELGIDPATLQAKPDAVKKWNGYLTEADTKYTQATAAQTARTAAARGGRPPVVPRQWASQQPAERPPPPLAEPAHKRPRQSRQK